AVEGKLAHPARTAPLHLLLHPRMRDDQFPVIEDVVADETIEKVRDLFPESGGLAFELRERVRETVHDLHIAAAELTDEFDIVVAGDAERVAARHHAHDETQHGGNLRTTVDEVTEEDRLAALRRCHGDR